MQLRTEMDLRKLLQAWDGRESDILRFTDIVNATVWNKRKVSYLLKKGVEEGYLENYKASGASYYRFKLADYRGYFDTLQFLARVDLMNRRRGTILSREHPLHAFSHFHVLAYGVPSQEELTSLEREMLFSIFSRLTRAFMDYSQFCRAIQERKALEHKDPLPDSVAAPLFSYEKGSGGPLTSVPAAHQLYGDVLWEHIFFKIVGDIRFALEKGSLDFAGPVELLNSNSQLAELALALARDIHAGKLSDYRDPDPDATEKMYAQRGLKRLFEKTSDDVAIVLTPSPETLEEFATQIGKIVSDAHAVWSDPDFMRGSMMQRAGNLWDDTFDLERGRLLRRNLFRLAVEDTLASLRYGIEDPVDQSDAKFMLADRRLREVFSTDEILGIISQVRGLIRRAKNFYRMIENGESREEIENHEEWFSRDELHDYRLAQNVESAARWQDEFGTLDPVEFEMPEGLSRMGGLIEAYQEQVGQELKKRGILDEGKEE